MKIENELLVVVVPRSSFEELLIKENTGLRGSLARLSGKLDWIVEKKFRELTRGIRFGTNEPYTIKMGLIRLSGESTESEVVKSLEREWRTASFLEGFSYLKALKDASPTVYEEIGITIHLGTVIRDEEYVEWKIRTSGGTVFAREHFFGAKLPKGISAVVVKLDPPKKR